MNLDNSPNGVAYFLEKIRWPNLPFQGVISQQKSLKIDSTDMKHLCCNFLSILLVSHTHTCGAAHTLKLGEAASFDKVFPF